MYIMESIRKRSMNPFAASSITIACMGDSVTHGCFEMFVDVTGKVSTRYSPGESYVQRLQDYMNAVFPVAAVNVVNCGISGDRAALALKRYERDVQCYNPDLTVFCYGLNDCVYPTETPESFADCMGELFSLARAGGSECILLTPNMMGTYIDPSITAPLVREVAVSAVQVQCDGTLSAYVSAAMRRAREMNVPIADAYSEWQALANSGADVTRLLANGINHPSAFMHEIFMRKIVECMLDL